MKKLEEEDQIAVEKEYKIIILTYRTIDNPLFRPAEETFLDIIFEKLETEHEKIEYVGKNDCIFCKLPILYYHGQVITTKFIPFFVLNLINKNSSIGKEIQNQSFYEQLFYILDNQLRFASEYYIYLKTLEKINKNKENKIISGFSKSFIIKDKNYEVFCNDILSNFNININTSNNEETFEFDFLDNIEKSKEIIKDGYNKLDIYINQIDSEVNTNSVYLIKLLIFSFLSEINFLFLNKIQIWNPMLTIENSLDVDLYKKINLIFDNYDLFFKDKARNIKFEIAEDTISNNIVKKFSFALNPDKKKIVNIEQMQINTSFYHTLFVLGLFVGISGFFYYASTKNIKAENERRGLSRR